GRRGVVSAAWLIESIRLADRPGEGNFEVWGGIQSRFGELGPRPARPPAGRAVSRYSGSTRHAGVPRTERGWRVAVHALRAGGIRRGYGAYRCARNAGSGADGPD